MVALLHKLIKHKMCFAVKNGILLLLTQGHIDYPRVPSSKCLEHNMLTNWYLEFSEETHHPTTPTTPTTPITPPP